MISLKSDFQQWASELPEGDGSLSIIIETKESIFLTFNYSLTLERLYGIPRDRILHIHGSSRDKESIVVGHGRDFDSYRNDLTDDFPDPPDKLTSNEYEQWFNEMSQTSDDYPTSQAKDAAASAIEMMRKNVSEIIAANADFFNSLQDVDNIHIYGLSFADVDLPYLLEIVKNVDIQNTDLEISYHSEKDLEMANGFIKKIPRPRKVDFIKLDDIILHKQLRLF